MPSDIIKCLSQCFSPGVGDLSILAGLHLKPMVVGHRQSRYQISTVPISFQLSQIKDIHVYTPKMKRKSGVTIQTFKLLQY